MQMRAFLILAMCFVFGLAKGQDPDPPTITHLSIDSLTQEVSIYWYNNAPTAVGYIIYFQDAAGLWIPLDTVYGQQTLSYTTQTSNAQFEEETYSVVAFDALGNSSARSESHSTLWLTYHYFVCDTICILKWELYPEMLNQQGFILRATSKSMLTGVETTNDIALATTDSTYHFSVDYTTKYTFTLIAYNDLDSLSRSNRFAIVSTQVIPPTYAYLNKVSVNEQESIEVHIQTNSDFVDYFEVYKTSLPNTLFKHIGNADMELSSRSALLLDQNVSPESNIYQYKVKAVDICGKKYNLPSSPDTLNIFPVSHLQLEATSLDAHEMDLHWNDYSFFMQEEEHALWLEVNGNAELVSFVASNDYGTVRIGSEVGLICVYLTANEVSENSLGLKDTVYSNKVCMTKEPLLHFPSAFTPANGDIKNNVWKPSIIGEEAISTYTLKIFNRWGVLIKTISETSGFWDGFYKGEKAEVGGYSYHLQFTYGDAQVAERKGTITLLR